MEAKTKAKKSRKAAAADKEKNVLYFRTGAPDGCIVLKVVEDEQGTHHVESEHKVNELGCDCEAFKFRKQCRHMNMFLLDRVEGAAVDLSSARQSIRELIQLFGAAFRTVKLPNEPYERDESGKVVCATILLQKPIKKSAILRSGTWEGCLKTNGMRVRMIISE